MRFPLPSAFVPWLVIAGFQAGVVRAEGWPVECGPSREPMPYRYDAKDWQQIPKNFLEDAPAVVLYTATTHRIEEDGTVETTSHEITRLNGRKGVESLGEYHSISYDPAYQKLVLNEARVLKASGKIVPIEAKHVQLRDVATDYQIYDQDKQLVISFPNLEVGDVYEVRWTVRGKNPEFHGKFFTRYNFGDDTYPTVRDEFHVVLPGKEVLKYAALNGKLDLRVYDFKDRKHYYWRATNRPQLPRDEDRPSKEELRLQVACSTFASWDEVARWKQKLRKDCWKCTPPVRQVVDEVTKGLKTDLEKTRALTHWVRRNVRYLSRGPGGAGYTPHLPHQVLANLFGDCKDQSQLLAVMLREIGLSPYLVTLGTLDDGQVSPEVPSPWGTHALLMVPIARKEYWIDTTITQAAWDYLPRADRDRQAYLTRDAELKLLRTPPMSYHDSRIETTTHLAIRPDGTSRCQRKLVLHGSSALARRDAWLEVPQGERRRLLTAELQDANSRTRLLSMNVDERNLLDFDQPVDAQVVFEIPRHFTGELSKEGSLTDSQVWSRLLAYTLDPDRNVPLQLGGPFESVHKYVLRLPPAYRFDDFPKKQDVASPWGFFKLNVVPDPRDPRLLELVMHTRLEKVRIERQDFAAFQKFHEEVHKAYRVWVNLRPSSDLADAPLLETLLALAPGSDTVSAQVLAKLYIDHERFADARRVLRTACLYHCQDIALWELSVKAAANLAEEEQLYSQMVRIFPKDAKLAIALGATRVKRHDHASARKALEPLAAHESASIRGAAQYQLARSYFQDKQYTPALKHLELAVLADPQVMQEGSASRFKALVHETLGQVQEAIAAYRDALGHDRDSADTLVPLIRLELQAGKNADALDHLRRYSLEAGGDVSGLTRAAEFHLQMGRLEDAFELANRARDLGFNARTQRVLGLVHFRKKDWDKAVFHLDRADADADVLEGLIQSHLAQGDVPAAEKLLEPARMLRGKGETPGLEKTRSLLEQLVQRRELLWKDLALPAEKRASGHGAIQGFLCAELAFQEGRPRDVVAKMLGGSFTEGINLGPALGLRGLLFLEKGLTQKALADAVRALQQKPPDARAHLVRGRIRLDKGDLPGALSDLERAATLSNKQDAHILHWLATALFEAGRKDDALTVQRRAVQLLPQDRELAEQLREIEKAVPKAGI